MKDTEIRKLYKEPNEYIVIELTYKKDGFNSFLNENEKRGYYLYFLVQKISGRTREYTPLDDNNFKLLIKEVKRYSQKTMKQLEEKFTNNGDELFNIYKRYLNGERVSENEIQDLFN